MFFIGAKNKKSIFFLEMTSNRSKTVPNIPKRYLNIILLCFTVFYGDYGLISVILTILVRFWYVFGNVLYFETCGVAVWRGGVASADSKFEFYVNLF